MQSITPFVAPVGLEPTLLSEPDFESGASAIPPRSHKTLAAHPVNMLTTTVSTFAGGTYTQDANLSRQAADLDWLGPTRHLRFRQCLTITLLVIYVEQEDSNLPLDP